MAKTDSIRIGVWLIRVIIGAIFIFSGFVKAVDIWGSVFKFEEYFTVWGLSIPDSLTVVAAMTLSTAEFTLGALLLLGCYRRLSTCLLLAMMAVMLPLTAYLWVENPVADCGCFGDYLVISNGASFAKNIFITAGLVLLLIYNRKVKGLFHPYAQWLVGVALVVFCTAVELYGYNVQPMIDFRPYPIGTDLAKTDGLDTPVLLKYRRGNVTKGFSADSLPDSTWTFIERIETESTDGTSDSGLVILNSEGEDVSDDFFSDDDVRLLAIIPEYSRAEMYYTSFLNELYEAVTVHGGTLDALTDLASEQIDSVKEATLAQFPIYHSDPLSLKELSRGIVSIVFVHNGKIQWKRTLSSIDVEKLTAEFDLKALNSLAIPAKELLLHMTAILLIALLAIFAIDRILRPFSKKNSDITEPKASE